MVGMDAKDRKTERLERLGEEKFRIYQTGSPGLDGLAGARERNAGVLSEAAGLDVREDFVVVLQHPAGGTAKERRYVCWGAPPEILPPKPSRPPATTAKTTTATA